MTPLLRRKKERISLKKIGSLLLFYFYLFLESELGKTFYFLYVVIILLSYASNFRFLDFSAFFFFISLLRSSCVRFEVTGADLGQ